MHLVFFLILRIHFLHHCGIDIYNRARVVVDVTDVCDTKTHSTDESAGSAVSNNRSETSNLMWAGGAGALGVKTRGEGRSGLLSTAAEIDSDKGVNFCLLAQRFSDLICYCWGEGRPAGQ